MDSLKSQVLNIPLLNGENFASWKAKLKALLVRDELWDVVNTRKPDPVTDTWKKKNNKAMLHIIMSVEDNQLIHFEDTEEAYEAWQILLKKYDKSMFASSLYLRKKLYGIHYKTGPISEHIDAIMNIVEILRGSGKLLDDEEIVAVLLASLPESYSGLVTALEGREEKDLTVEYVTGKILDEYRRRTEASTISESNGGDLEVALRSVDPSKNNRYTSKNQSGKGIKLEKENTVRRVTRASCCNHEYGYSKPNCKWCKKMFYITMNKIMKRK